MTKKRVMDTVGKTEVSIYALRDPRDGRVRYIGKSKNVLVRYKQHIGENRRNTPLYAWISDLKAHGLLPVVEVVRSCSESEWKDVERQEIVAARAAHGDLLNVADGGNQPYCPKHICADNGRNNAKARVSTPEKAKLYKIKRELGIALKLGYVSEQSKAKMRLAAQMRPDLFGLWAGI